MIIRLDRSYSSSNTPPNSYSQHTPRMKQPYLSCLKNKGDEVILYGFKNLKQAT